MCQVLFDKVWNFSPKYPMTITHSEEVCPPILTQVRHHQVLVLVDLIRVLGTKTSLGRKGKLSHTIVELFYWSRHLLCYILLSLLDLLGSWRLRRLMSWVNDYFGQVTLTLGFLLLGWRQSTIFKLSTLGNIHMFLALWSWSLVSRFFLFIASSDLLSEFICISGWFDLWFTYGGSI